MNKTDIYLFSICTVIAIVIAVAINEWGAGSLLIFVVLLCAYLALRWPELAIYLLIFSIPFEGIPLMEQFSITRLAGIVALVMFLVMVLFGRIAIRISKLDVLVFVYYVVCVASLIWAIDLPTSEDALTRLSMIMIMYVMIANFCTNERRAEGILWSYSIGCVVSIIFALATGKAIVQGDLFRLFGAIGDPNEFVQAIAVAFPFMAYVSQKHPSRKIRWFALAATALFMIATVLSGSRSGLLWLVAICVILGYQLLLKEWRYSLILPAICLLLAVLYVVPQGTLDRLMTSTNPRAERGDSTIQRLTNYQAAIDIMFDHPLGVGLRNFKTVSSNYGAYTGGLVSHNTLLEIGTGVGLLGVFIFMLIVISAVYVFKKTKITFNNYFVSKSYLYALFGFVFLGMFLSSDLDKMTYVLPAIASCFDGKFHKTVNF